MKTTRCISHVSLALLLAAGLGMSASLVRGADDGMTPHALGDKMSPTVATATAMVQPTKGNKVEGTVMFTEEKDGVRVTAAFTGLTPGEHGFHVHERGDCSAPDASSAGGHFNPTKDSHGARDAEHRHEGDLGNLVAGADGRAQLNFFDTKLTLRGPNSIIGKAVIVHVGADDLKTQPTGNAGGRAGCGVIQEVHP